MSGVTVPDRHSSHSDTYSHHFVKTSRTICIISSVLLFSGCFFSDDGNTYSLEGLAVIDSEQSIYAEYAY
jgi:hypothetical protein